MDLADALEELAGELPARRLADEVERWQRIYRDPAADLAAAPRLTPEQAIAYAVYRMPATYAATTAALTEVAAAMPDFAPVSMLDIGAGAGAASWSATDVFPSMKDITAIERDPAMRAVGQRLAERTYVTADLATKRDFPSADLAVASYSLNELSTVDTVIAELARKVQTIVIVEPGTPRGFAGIRAIRRQLVDLGMRVAAPCPHDGECPIVDPDWCHFSVRLQRSAVHRRAKRADLGYEDEKFSYVAATRLPVERASARVLRHPQIRSGHVMLRLCRDGIEDVTVSKRQGDAYKRARRILWGDAF
ncbi:small ribosomal subunit Rsm22 family protein [Fodinicola acaciae]|uniref:small ribosomal subunit Rsm22 family protein n=1 Tax=Fodinicola acaciae TaxID=2681555 RepID=UPI0013D1D723|nr:small ribosomal subunit Rsm22 family protein [Fodinicola acaciae]